MPARKFGITYLAAARKRIGGVSIVEPSFDANERALP
jgi:hypothetical protein